MTEPVGILGQIAAAKKLELARRFEAVSIDRLRSSATPTARSLSAVLAKTGARFILEIKKASPSEGLIRPGADPRSLARAYGGVADALSVLCDGPYFGGSLDDLSAARREFDGPILAKDFFLDARQVPEARLAGADAVLVMLSVLDDQRASEIIAEAQRFRMDAIIEVHDEAEMSRAVALGARIIGINNRDLRDLTIDLGTTERLARSAGPSLIISESGIQNRADIDRLAPLVDGFLIGSSLMRVPEPATAARELIFGRTKLCGLNSREALEAARPATFAGLVLVPGSPRDVPFASATLLAEAARRSGMLPVAVFRDAPLHEVAHAAKTMHLHAVQLHGREDQHYVSQLRSVLGGSCEIWTAASVGRDSLSGRGGDRLLFDNGDGGTGSTFDWSLISGHPELPRALLAGGIGPDNALAATAVGAYAIDVGSGVDTRPGFKSPSKTRALFDALRPLSRKAVLACA